MIASPRANAPGLAAGIDEKLIGQLVDQFYAAVRNDDILGPVFETRIEDWEKHLEKLRGFWSSVVLMTGRYKGQPMPVHVAITEISDIHFERWLKLFAETASNICPPDAAALFIDRSRRIAQSLKLGVALNRGDDSVLMVTRGAGA
jgi:hemoglobin